MSVSIRLFVKTYVRYSVWLNVQSHDIVVHVVAIANGEVAFAQLPHAHVLVEVEGFVVAVYIQFHKARSGVDGLDVAYGLFK